MRLEDACIPFDALVTSVGRSTPADNAVLPSNTMWAVEVNTALRRPAALQGGRKNLTFTFELISENPSARARTKPRHFGQRENDMIIERDLPVPMDDGLALRADVFLPDTAAPAPVTMTLGPYGKGVRYQDHYKVMWDWLVGQHPDLLQIDAPI